MENLPPTEAVVSVMDDLVQTTGRVMPGVLDVYKAAMADEIARLFVRCRVRDQEQNLTSRRRS